MMRLAAALAILALVSGCGDDDDDASVDDTSTTIVVEAGADPGVGNRSVVSTTTTNPADAPAVPAVGDLVEVRFVEPSRSEATPMTWVVEVDNVSDDPVTLTFPTGQRAEVVLLDGETVVHRWSDGRFFDQSVTTLVLEPDQVETFELPDDLASLPAGRYGLQVELSIIDPPPADDATFRVVSS